MTDLRLNDWTQSKFIWREGTYKMRLNDECVTIRAKYKLNDELSNLNNGQNKANLQFNY